MFHRCYSLTSINLGKYNFENVENIRYIFYLCSKLNYIDISSFKDSIFYDNFLYGLPKNGTIKVNENFIGKIKSQILPSWEIIIIN